MEVVICAIARLENRYIKEWVDYHLALGFNHIYIYDNNRDGEECISDVLDGRYYKSVTIIPFHVVEKWPQIQAYEDCWKRFSFDWILYIDIDEFFTFGEEWVEEKNIDNFVAKYNTNWDAVLINWMCYGDNEKIHYSQEPIVDRFPNPLPLNFSKTNMWGKQPLNGHVKTLVRHDCSFRVCNPHVGSGDYRCCNSEAEEVENFAWQQKQTYSNAYIRHYITKTISEYAKSKAIRGFADRDSNQRYSIAGFFGYNKPTIKKMRICYKYLRETNEKLSIIWIIKQFLKFTIFIPLSNFENFLKSNS